MDEPRPSSNPYSAPAAPLLPAAAAVVPRATASRWKRLGAYLLDLALLFACCVPVGMSSDRNGGGDASDLATAATLLMFLALLIVNLVLLARYGQTPGKRVLGIRIVRLDGSPAGLGRTFGVRYVVNGLIGIVPFYALIDPLYIFSADRRCLHDHLAGTIVVDA